MHTQSGWGGRTSDFVVVMERLNKGLYKSLVVAE